MTNTQYNLRAINEELSKLRLEKLVKIFVILQWIFAKKVLQPEEIGNSGSFFMNPIIKSSKFKKYKGFYPDIVGYKMSKRYKVAVDYWKMWMERSRKNDVGIHKNQLFVLVNYGELQGEEIFLLRKIQKSVKENLI